VTRKNRQKRDSSWLIGLGFLAAFWIGVPGLVQAVTANIWLENSQTTFELGEAEGVSLNREGVVTLGPQWTVMADTGEHFVWSLASDRTGTLYMGTGTEGRIFALKPGSNPVLLFDAEEESKIFSLSVGPDGALYAGTSPNGLIYRITDGKTAEVFSKTGDLHVWSMVWVDGTLFAATGGEKGRVLKVSQNRVEEVYRSHDPNMVSLVRGTNGSLIAGTDQNGLIYSISSKGQTSVLYDAGETEVHAIAVDKQGMVYAAVMSGRSESNSDGKNEGAGEKSVLYAIRPSGSATRLWEIDDPLLLAVIPDPDGSLRVVTGNKGRVYQVWPNGTYALLAQLKDVHPWAVLPASDGGLWVGSSGDGKIFALGKPYVSQGTLTSAARDFTLISSWGQAHWQADTPPGTTVALVSRSGNSEKPDDTWSAWSGPILKPGMQVASPPARFLQYRMILKSSTDQSTPQLREVRLSGLQENVAPIVLSVKVGDGDDSPETQVESQTLRKIAWEAADVNDDAMTSELFFREVGTSQWLLLKEDVTGLKYGWDTQSVPDGTYQIRVVVSDQASNPPAIALRGEATSAPFVVDNTSPSVKIAAVRTEGTGEVRVSGSVLDAGSALLSAKYAVNSGDWEMVFAEDGIFDSSDEKLSFGLPGLAPGVYTLVIRAEDARGNVGVGKTRFEVK
jgi:hypothetical protein